MVLLSIWWGGVVVRARVGKPVLREVTKAVVRQERVECKHRAPRGAG